MRPRACSLGARTSMSGSSPLWTAARSALQGSLGGREGVFIEDVRRGVVADLEVDLPLVGVLRIVEVLVEDAVAEAVGPRLIAAAGRARGRQLVDLDEAVDDLAV